MAPRTLTRLAAVAVALALGTLYSFPPSLYSFYPLCPIARWTGLHCPGCGSTRALYELLHGNFAQAMYWNPLATLMSPCLVLWCMRQYWSAEQTNCFRSRHIPRAAYYAAAVIIVTFSILRNLPGRSTF